MPATNNNRLDSWKEIADYLGRDVTTVIRWEKEKGLPVHRVPGGKRHAVFAFTEQIDTWMLNGAGGRSESGTQSPTPAAISFGQRERDASPSALGGQMTQAAARNVPGFRLPYLAYVAIPIALAAAMVYLLARAAPAPRILGYTQLTNDGRLKGGGLATDGPRLYFIEKVSERWVIVQMATAGGEVVPVSGALKNPLIQDLSQARSELLVLDAGSNRLGPLFALPLPGGSPRRIGNVLATSAAWSPDGQTIAYTADDGVYVSRWDGAEPRRVFSVTGEVPNICWHPTGRMFCFRIRDPRSNSASYWEARPDGGEAHPFIPVWWLGQTISGGTWTPDGRFFIFVSRTGRRSDLWALREGTVLAEFLGRRPTQLTAGPMEFGSVVPSRDGKRAFAIGGTGRSQLERYDQESRQFVPYLPQISADFADFSSDGEWMAYVALSDGALWKSRINGSESVQLTFPPMETELPRWSPDSRWIAFMGREPGKPWKVRLIPATGGLPQTVTSGADQEGAPTWSPDGGRLIFGSLVAADVRSSGPLVIHMVDLRTHEGSTVPGSEGLWTARWSASGRYVAAITADSRSLMLFDFSTKKWVKLLSVSFIRDIIWSRREDAIFLSCAAPSGEESFISRLRLRDRKLEQVARLQGKSAGWLGLTLADSPLVTRQLGAYEIYALDWQLP